MAKIDPEEVRRHKESGDWRVLEGLAKLTIDKAESAAKSRLNPVLGGGTRLMLSMRHRISDDIDLFIHDPQWLPYLTPRLNDAIEDLVSDYDEGTTSLKLSLEQGEIDFIVSTPLLGLPNEKSSDSIFELEPVAEVLAKKLFHRGHVLTPRDLFDWRLIETILPADEVHADAIAIALRGKLDGLDHALQALSKLPGDHVKWTGIRTPYPLDLQETVAWATARVQDFRFVVAEHDKQRTPPAAAAGNEEETPAP
jgi:hypothetical protein